MAVRLSLGGTRQQLLRQLLTESILLAVLGGLVSLFVAQLTLGLLMALSVRSTRSEIRDAYEWLNGHWDSGLDSCGRSKTVGLQ